MAGRSSRRPAGIAADRDQGTYRCPHSAAGDPVGLARGQFRHGAGLVSPSPLARIPFQARSAGRQPSLQISSALEIDQRLGQRLQPVPRQLADAGLLGGPEGTAAAPQQPQAVSLAMAKCWLVSIPDTKPSRSSLPFELASDSLILLAGLRCPHPFALQKTKNPAALI
jgi:hypothetical protein